MPLYDEGDNLVSVGGGKVAVKPVNKAVPKSVTITSGGAGTLRGEFKTPLDVREQTARVERLEKETKGGILSQVDNMTEIVNQAVDYLEGRKLLGPAAGRASGFAAAELGGGGYMNDRDTVNRSIAYAYSKQLQYAAAAGIAKQEGRGLSDADLRLAGAVAPDIDKETYPTVRSKTALLKGMASGKISKKDITDILAKDTWTQDFNINEKTYSVPLDEVEDFKKEMKIK